MLYKRKRQKQVGEKLCNCVTIKSVTLYLNSRCLLQTDVVKHSGFYAMGLQVLIRLTLLLTYLAFVMLFLSPPFVFL